MLLRNNNITECFLTCKVKVKVAQLCPTFCNSSWNSPGQNARVDSCSLLQGIFPSQGSNPGLLHCRQILYQLSHQGMVPKLQCCFSSVAQSCPALCDPMDCSMPGFPVPSQTPEATQTHVHWVGDAIQPSHPLLSPSPPAPNPSQHQGLFQWVNCSHEVAKILEFQHQSFQWTSRTDLL